MPAAKKGGKATSKKSSKPAAKPAAVDPGQTQPVVQEAKPDKDVVTDDAGRPETHDNFGEPDNSDLHEEG